MAVPLGPSISLKELKSTAQFCKLSLSNCALASVPTCQATGQQMDVYDGVQVCMLPELAKAKDSHR